jgi:integrase
MKADREHRVPLSPRALEIVGELATEARKRSPDIGTMPIFHGARWTRPLSNMSLTAVLRRMKLDVVPHGFRSTFKTWASERTNFQREVVEAALAHVTGDKVEAAYQRGDLFDKRRRLMNAWASFTATALTTADVIPIGRVS